jgi:hypothetical protein
MLLGHLQAFLTDFYDLEIAHDIYDFLITDSQLAGLLDSGGRDTDEKLLIAEVGGEAGVSLYLHEELIGRLHANDPVTRLNGDNIADFWTAFEGVSHFTCFAWRASIDMPVTLLEMELQAEVDKFVATALLLRRQGERLPHGLLHHWLFTLPRFDDDLNAEELERYGRANYYAGKYCRSLWPLLAREQATAELRNELRRFYRLPHPAKIDMIEGR